MRGDGASSPLRPTSRFPPRRPLTSHPRGRRDGVAPRVDRRTPVVGGGTMYEGFSAQARKAVDLAHREARRLNHDHLGTEHLLLGVFRVGSDGGAAMLRAFDLDPETAYRE